MGLVYGYERAQHVHWKGQEHQRQSRARSEAEHFTGIPEPASQAKIFAQALSLSPQQDSVTGPAKRYEKSIPSENAPAAFQVQGL